MLGFLRGIRALALGVWLGGIVMAFVAAPIVFKMLSPDKAKAGQIVGTILHAGSVVSIIVGLVALLAEAPLFFGKVAGAPAGKRRFITVSCIMAALAITLFVVLWLEPAMLKLRDEMTLMEPPASQVMRDSQIQLPPPTAASPLANEAHQKFMKLHGASMGLGVLEAILVALALFVAAL